MKIRRFTAPLGTFAVATLFAVAPPTSAHADGTGATDFGTRNGDTAIVGEVGGILNTYGASLVNDLRCAVPLPEGEGIGGHLLGGPKAACNVAPVD
ncbi:hypothetical protein AB0D78_34925 [Streptomyces avermitilis]|uniref:hypothetical protein n=1 Tax=Streptomyces avermitilis TaxID=33903 RepID=UPI003404A890